MKHTLSERGRQENMEDDLDDWLTVHRSITLVNLQLYAQNSLFIYI